MRLVVAHNAQEREAERFRERNDAFIDSLMHMRRLTYLSGGVPGLLLALGTGAVFLIGGWRVIDGRSRWARWSLHRLSDAAARPIQSFMGLYASFATARVRSGECTRSSIRPRT